ncbi:DUF1127 domain-containing protein [Arhodomonas sp. SL1]|uniref:DUF1127 domain-containing protein n=1 Tax=Arhodomonas sp. SL1 TaxID=3425691 RepID=UPI003F88230E
MAARLLAAVAQGLAWAVRPIGTIWLRLGRWIRDYRRYRRVLAEVSRLDDRMLRDLGVRREDLWLAARDHRPGRDQDV